MPKHSSELKTVLVLSAVETLDAETGTCNEKMLHRIVSDYQDAFGASMFSFHPSKRRMVSADLKNELGNCFHCGFLKWQPLEAGNQHSIMLTDAGRRFAGDFPVIGMAFKAGIKSILLTEGRQPV